MSDGTSLGTVLVEDIRPGTIGSYPAGLTNVNGTLFFSANDGTNGYELWKGGGISTGAVGAVLVRDILSGTASSNLGWPTNVNGTLFFTARDETHGFELWKSDGTSSGTVLVKDIRPGGFGAFPHHLTNVNGTLFFVADDGSHGRELWKSDGTAAGTVLVRDISPGTLDSSPRGLTNVNGTLFFTADDGSHGFELWKSDGTAAGTVLVRDIFSGGGELSSVSVLANQLQRHVIFHCP
jgi:ELWxxDGT repeat protein